MSILTKILAVLLSVFSLLMAGMFVVYVGVSNNYKELYEDELLLNTNYKGTAATITEEYNKQLSQIVELKKDHEQKLSASNKKVNDLNNALLDCERKAGQYQADANRWKGVLDGLQQHAKNLEGSRSKAQTLLDKARLQGINDRKERAEAVAALEVEKAKTKQLEAEKRRLLEKNKGLEGRLAALEKEPPKEIIPSVVTPLPNRRATSLNSVPTAGTNNIKGKILEVGQNMASLSVGSADGVKEKMIFHVYRGIEFICDVNITNVDINRCAGTLELVVGTAPTPGDIATTQPY